MYAIRRSSAELLKYFIHFSNRFIKRCFYYTIVVVHYIYLIFYIPPVYTVPTATLNDGRNLFFVFTIVTVIGGWVVEGH